MSYYERSSYKFTDHAIVRAKQRISGLAEYSDLMIQTKILTLLRQLSGPEFIDKNYKYFRIQWERSKYLYVVVTKNTNIIVTITNINMARKVSICNTI